jgi:hypothetical protein
MLVIMQLVLFLVGLVRMLLNSLVKQWPTCLHVWLEHMRAGPPLGHHHPDCQVTHTLGGGEEAGGLRMGDELDGSQGLLSFEKTEWGKIEKTVEAYQCCHVTVTIA